jgi:hypothetical protein
MTTASPTDGGKVKILKLKHRIGKEKVFASTNKDKSVALEKCFFSIKLQETGASVGEIFPKVCKGVGIIMREQFCEQLRKTKPFKAPGPDSIPNIILSKYTDIIINRLFLSIKQYWKRVFYTAHRKYQLQWYYESQANHITTCPRPIDPSCF